MRRTPSSGCYWGFVLCLRDTLYLFLAIAIIAYALRQIKFTQLLYFLYVSLYFLRNFYFCVFYTFFFFFNYLFSILIFICFLSPSNHLQIQQPTTLASTETRKDIISDTQTHPLSVARMGATTLDIISQGQKCHKKPFPLVYHQSHKEKSVKGGHRPQRLPLILFFVGNHAGGENGCPSVPLLPPVLHCPFRRKKVKGGLRPFFICCIR